MSTYNKMIQTWIGNANSIVEKGKEKKHLLGDGIGDGVLNSFSLERFGDACLEGIDLPAWIEESFYNTPSSNFSNHIYLDNHTTNVKKNSSPCVPYNEHNYAITTPDNELCNNSFENEADNILPIIDDLLGNAQSYNLDTFIEDSPFSSPDMLPASGEEIGFQNLEEFLAHPVTGLDGTPTNPAAESKPAHMLTNSAGSGPVHMLEDNGGLNSLPVLINADSPISITSKGNTHTSSVAPENINMFNNDLSSKISALSETASPSYIDDVLMDSGISSPQSDFVSSPESSYMSQLASEDSYSNSESSPQIPWYDGQAGTQSHLVQLLLGGLSDQSTNQTLDQIDFNLLDDTMSSSSASSCDDDELNRILDGDYSRPRSVSASSITSTNSTSANSLLDNEISISHHPNQFNAEALVPASLKSEMSTGKARKTPRKSTSKKNQNRFEPYITDLTTSEMSEGSDDKQKGRKVYKTKEAKERKMSQNRTAAFRYRQKKKNELAEIEQEADELEATNGKLKTKVEDMHREIDYLKNLMMDVIKAKLSVNSKADREETLKLLDELTATEVAT